MKRTTDVLSAWPHPQFRCYADIDADDGMRWIPLCAVALPFMTAVASASPLPSTLETGQSILMADQTLISDGWNPVADQSVEPFEQDLAGNTLSSLASCSGTGVRYCRYDYRRQNLRLFVVTIPAERPDEAGQVARWWTESTLVNPER